jgi:hypothetical protein
MPEPNVPLNEASVWASDIALVMFGGGVEGQIGWFRRNHLVPVPDVPSIGALNAMIDQWDAGDEARRVGGRARTVGDFLAVERPLLRPLPEEPFETGLWLTPRVDRFAQVMVRNNRYTVPVRLIGRRLGKLPPDTRPLPSVAAYDQLLRRNRTAQEGPRP